MLLALYPDSYTASQFFQGFLIRYAFHLRPVRFALFLFRGQKAGIQAFIISEKQQVLRCRHLAFLQGKHPWES